MEIGFGEALLLGGALLAVAAALSGVMHGTVLSISVLSVTAGIVLALTDVIELDARDEGIVELIELALVVTLLSDGLLVERELLLRHWGPTARALILAMPLTMLLLAVGARVLFPALSWEEAFLLGAVLAPTDPVITSAVVAARRVPGVIRHTLNLESGLNDGLALPFVLFFLVLATAGADPGGEAAQLLGEAAIGAAIGVLLGVAGGRLVPHLPGGMTRKYEPIYALGLGLFAFGISDVTIGNGLIAAFVTGIALGAAKHEIPESFVEFNENVSSILQVLTFFVFGGLIVATGYGGSVPALVAFVAFVLLVGRPAAVLVAFLRLRLPRAQQLFIAWFGPKGVASMLFALFVLKSTVAERTEVFEIAAFVILSSIIAHGLTDTVGAQWIERRVAAESE